MVRQTRIEGGGNIRLPADVCRRYGWHEGDRLVIQETAEGMLLRRSDAESDDAALGQAGEQLAGETVTPEDFSAWESRRD
jgi:bifunctional DNA-binding transcriptional regulator/antitoxin component of YhaV-PrlF toxin-antitoxin module